MIGYNRGVQFCKYLLSVFLVLVIIGPLLVVLFASFKTREQMTVLSPLLLPSLNEITFENYLDVFHSKHLLTAIKNIVIILVFSLSLNVILGSITAYVLERFQFRFKRIVISLFFLGMMVPSFVMEISRFKIIQKMGFYNTLKAPIIIYIAADLMQLYLYRQFVSQIPVEIEESALIDGCGYFGVFWKIIFPLLKPATATVLIIKTVNIINDMYIPYLYMPGSKQKVLSTFLMGYASAQQGSWQTLSAAIVVVALPTLLLYIVFKRSIIGGIAAGAIKG